MKVDFLILYEHKSREIESSCLLSAELKRRGYSVKIMCIYDYTRYYVKPRVLIVPHLYNNQQLLTFGDNKWHTQTAIISMQYEQVLTVSAEKDKNVFNAPKEDAKLAHHIAWGQSQVERYVLSGIEKKNIHQVGHINMDFLKPKFKDYYLSKDELATKYNLDKNKEWILFISSFATIHFTDKDIRAWESQVPNIRLRNDLEKHTYINIIEWLKRAAIENPEKIIIYRPHPGEKGGNPALINLEATLDNFKIINEDTVRQWIVVSNQIYTWISTSIIDVYFAKRNCQILRPIHIDGEYDISIIEKSPKLESVEEFLHAISYNDAPFPICEKDIMYYYGNGDGYAYLAICDLCEKLINREIESHQFLFTTSFQKKHNRIRYLISSIIAKQFKINDIPILNFLLTNKRFLNMTKEMFHINRTISRYEKRIKNILLDNNE